MSEYSQENTGSCGDDINLIDIAQPLTLSKTWMKHMNGIFAFLASSRWNTFQRGVAMSAHFQTCRSVFAITLAFRIRFAEFFL